MKTGRALPAVTLVFAGLGCVPASTGEGNTAPGTHVLQLKAQGAGTGKIQGAGITDCRTSCTALLAVGTQLTLVATADSGSSFAGWSGACTGLDACKLTVDADRAVTATFAPVPPPPPGKHSLTVAKSGSGRVTSTPSGIDCGSTCSAAFDDGVTVELTAAADAGFHFAGFTSACSGKTCKVTLRVDTLVQARFEADAPPPSPPPGMHAIIVTRSGAGTGSVTSSPAGIDCGATCSASLIEGTQVTLAAAATSSSRFTGWSGACSGTDPCTIALRADAFVDAGFEPLPPDECAALAPRPLPKAVTASMGVLKGKGNARETGCGPGNTDGSGRVAVFTPGDSVSGSAIAIYDPSGKRLNLTKPADQLVGPLLEQLAGFTGNEATRAPTRVHPFAIAPDGTLSEPSTTGSAVLDPLGGMVAFDAPTSGSAPPPDTFLEAFDAKAKLRWRKALGRQQPSSVGVDRQGNILMVFAADGRLKGQWADHDGQLGAVFDAGPDPKMAFTLVPRVGSGFFVQTSADQWVLQLDSRSTTASAAPAWLSPRHQKKIHMAYGGTAYALIDVPRVTTACTQQIEIVAPSGKSCGALDFSIQQGACTTSFLDVGYDGTVVQLLPVEATPTGSDGVKQCTWRWWTGVVH